MLLPDLGTWPHSLRIGKAGQITTMRHYLLLTSLFALLALPSSSSAAVQAPLDPTWAVKGEAKFDMGTGWPTLEFDGQGRVYVSDSDGRHVHIA